MRSRWSWLPALALVATAAGAGRADDQAEVKAVLARAIKATGGADRLAKHKALTTKFKGKVYLGENPTDYTAEWALQYPDKFKTSVSGAVMGQAFTFVMVVNKDKGWIKINDTAATDMPKDRLAEERETLYQHAVTSLVPLKDKAFQLSPAGDVKVGDHDAVGIKVSHKGHRDITLYFDKKTHLLLKTETVVKVMDTGKEVTQETLYEDYKKTDDGTLRAMKIKIKRDGKSYVDVDEISEIKYEEKLDDSVFEKP